MIRERLGISLPSATATDITLPGNEAGPSRTQVLVNAGLLFIASACHVSTEDLRIYPTLHGSTETELDTPRIFLSDKFSVVTDHEFHQVEQITPPALQTPHDLNSRLAKPLHSLDVDSLLYVQQTSG